MAEVAEALVLQYLPSVLVEVAGARVRDRLPRAYMTRTIASTLATLIVYREGLDYLDPLGDAGLGALALEYLRREQETARLVEAVLRSGLEERERIARLLGRAGTRAAIDEDPGPRD